MFINVTLRQAITRIQDGGILWSLDTGEGWELREPENWSKRAIRSWLTVRDRQMREWFTGGAEPRFKVEARRGLRPLFKY